MNSTQTLSPAAAIAPATQPAHRAIAPAWHTAVVILVLLGFSLAGALAGGLPGIPAHGRVYGYIVVMIFEWALVAFIGHELKRRGLSMADLVGGRWTSPKTFFRDLGLAVAFLLVCGIGVVNGLGYLLKVAPNAAIRNLLPHGPIEIILYMMLALTAGVCEEIIFRGYLYRQFDAMTQSSAGGLMLQGIVFGASHGYQGCKFMLLIAVYGSLFGLLTHWRRTLRPGMIAHFLQDGVGGLVLSRLMN